MNLTGYLLVFGTAALVVAAIVFGIWLHSEWGALLIVAGVVGAVAWVIMMLQLAAAFNSDI